MENEEEQIRAIGLQWIEDTIAAHRIQVKIREMQEKHKALRIKQQEADEAKRNKTQEVLALTIPRTI